MSKVTYGQKGYSGYRMSDRAVEAYDDGEMPKSKWTKKAMLETIAYEIDGWCIDEEAIDIFKKYNKEQLFDEFFEWKSWHHTGKFANETDFYGIGEFLVARKLIENGIGLDEYIDSSNDKIRSEVAYYGQEKHLCKLINDEDESVRRLVAKKGYGLDILINDNRFVREGVYLGLANASTSQSRKNEILKNGKNHNYDKATASPYIGLWEIDNTLNWDILKAKDKKTEIAKLTSQELNAVIKAEMELYSDYANNIYEFFEKIENDLKHNYMTINEIYGEDYAFYLDGDNNIALVNVQKSWITYSGEVAENFIAKFCSIDSTYDNLEWNFFAEKWEESKNHVTHPAQTSKSRATQRAKTSATKQQTTQPKPQTHDKDDK